jgi:LysM repeat protein
LYGTTAEEIATLNGLDPDDILAIGQRLVIP